MRAIPRIYEDCSNNRSTGKDIEDTQEIATTQGRYSDLFLRGLFITLFVNWLVKPFSMALISWVFFRHLFSAWVPASLASQYIAGTIILAAAPCTAMVFVWSYLTYGDPAYTLVQVSVNDLIMLFLFAPIVRFLVSGASSSASAV